MALDRGDWIRISLNQEKAVLALSVVKHAL